jgi:hypothetical protein
MSHLLLPFLVATLPTLVLAETGPTPRASRRTPALLAGPVLTYTEGLGEKPWRGVSGHLELGGSLPVGYEENELFLMARAGGGAPGFSLLAHGGLRSVFEGQDGWRTFVDLGAVVHVRPDFWAGPRVGVGVRRTLTERLSLQVGLGGQLGFGSGLRMDIELSTGVRWGL